MLEFVLKNWMLFAGLIVVLFLIVYDPLMRLLYGVRNLSVMRAPALINHENAVVVDVGEPKEFEAGHIPAAINIPFTKLRDGLQQLEKHKSKPMILCCRSGNRSAKAAVVLRRNGFESVYNLTGGMLAWSKENFPTEK